MHDPHAKATVTFKMNDGMSVLLPAAVRNHDFSPPPDRLKSLKLGITREVFTSNFGGLSHQFVIRFTLIWIEQWKQNASRHQLPYHVMNEIHTIGFVNRQVF